MTSSSSIDAAALQSEMTKRFGLKPAGLPGRRASKSAPTPVQRHCPSCDSNMGETIQEYCVQCGYGMPNRDQTEEPSWAQRRGLLMMPVIAKAAPDVMKPLDWYFIESQLSRKRDPDTCCPICMEAFNRGEEVLLSCGHIFHKVCLRSFENFVKNADLSCPICRAKNYQKKLTSLGHAALEKVSASRLQAIARGYLARKDFKMKLRRHYRSGKGNEALRTVYFQNECAAMTKRMDKTMNERGQQLDTMMRSMDRTLQDGKQLDELFEQMLLRRQQGQAVDTPALNSFTALAPPPASKPLIVQRIGDLQSYNPEELCEMVHNTWKG